MNWTLYDQFGNLLDINDGGGITWTVGGGVFTESNGTFFAVTVGNYVINMTSTSGLYYEIPIQIDHGEMDLLEINASSTFVTADDSVWLNTTRIDIMGNRLSVVIPQENWTISDGKITAGQPAVWEAQRRGSKSITASYAGMQNTVLVQVTEGAITGLILVIDSVEQPGNAQLNMTADDEVTVKVKATDADGNKWTENVAWNVEHILYSDQSVLQEMTYGSTTRFVPFFASENMYTLRSTYTDDNVTLTAIIEISVTHGDLTQITLDEWYEELLVEPEVNENINADENLIFNAILFDANNNPINSSITTYTLWDVVDTPVEGTLTNPTNITQLILDNDGVWEAGTVGDYVITAWAISNGGYNITASVNINVTKGVAVSVDIDVLANTAKAGDVYPITITGTDSDGNTFPQTVLWFKDGKPVPKTTIDGASGEYNWSATKAGQHNFTFRAPGAVNPAQGEWTVTVSAHQTVNRIELTISQESVIQLESFDIEVKTFDAWENQIPVPPDTKVTLTGRMTAEETENGKWTITTLDDGEQTVTISVHNKDASGTVTVEGTFMGFFEAGGTLYYAGGILAILVVIVLLVVIVMVFRSGSDDYDDDDDDDDYEYEEEEEEPSAGSRTGTGPTGPGPSGPPVQTYAPPQPDWAVEFRIDDDDGTAWAEADDGTWYYWDNDRSEWEPWE